MNKCKNCGSTAQFKRVLLDHNTDSLFDSIVEVWECQGCGYTENICYTFYGAIGKTADGTVIFKDRSKHE
jgi:MinD superfamily P-loop ATPase